MTEKLATEYTVEKSQTETERRRGGTEKWNESGGNLRFQVLIRPVRVSSFVCAVQNVGHWRHTRAKLSALAHMLRLDVWKKAFRAVSVVCVSVCAVCGRGTEEMDGRAFSFGSTFSGSILRALQGELEDYRYLCLWNETRKIT